MDKPIPDAVTALQLMALIDWHGKDGTRKGELTTAALLELHQARALTAAQPQFEGGEEDDDSVERCESALPTCGPAVAWDEDGIGACERCAKELGWLAQQSAPPSAPVEDAVAYLDNWLRSAHGLDIGRVAVGEALERALAQQPARQEPSDGDVGQLQVELVELRTAVEFHRLDAGALRSQMDVLRDALDIQRRNAHNALSMLEQAEARAERLEEALREWWEMKRPLKWSEAQHRETPCVNCATEADYRLAKLAALTPNAAQPGE